MRIKPSYKELEHLHLITANWTLKDVTKNGFDSSIWASGKGKVVWLIPTKESYSFLLLILTMLSCFIQWKKNCGILKQTQKGKNKRLHLAQKPDT